MSRVKKGSINLILTKDLSRLGRNYIVSGQYTEFFFPSMNVRFIAVNDGYDSAVSDSDMIPFKNIMNEMYARDISKKIRSSLRIRMKDGSYIGNFPPYGYEKHPGPPIHLVPDPEASPVVKQIFALGAEGMTPAQIARLLNASHTLSPSCYRLSKYPQLTENSYPSCGKWTANTILKMLHNPVCTEDIVPLIPPIVTISSPSFNESSISFCFFCFFLFGNTISRYIQYTASTAPPMVRMLTARFQGKR